jgi:ATP-dependent DNA helicase PIF1
MKDNKINLDLSSLSKQQAEVVEAFCEGKNLFVTGGAGSGKSYLLNFLKRNFSQYGLEITASTGIAAVNIGGSTIHSWAGIGLANMPVEQIIENIFSAKLSRVRRKIIQAKALAIDEISMIASDTLEIIDQVLRAVRQNDAPMGGLQILFFGDFLQLPPIKRNEQNIDFSFQSKTWRSLDLKVFKLEEIFRQKDQKFINVLNNLRFGKITADDRKALESRINARDENLAIRPTILTTHNAKVEKINETELKKIPQLEMAAQAEYFGDVYKVEFLKKNCIASDILRLKVGAQVMMIKNTYQKEGIINGSLGIIKDFSAKKNYPLVEFANGKIITISPEEWLIERFDEVTKTMKTEAGVKQIPLILAWAMTIHKSQGLTLDKISCDLSDIFSPGQAYVALSRARSLEGIFIESINFDRISANQDATKYYENL